LPAASYTWLVGETRDVLLDKALDCLMSAEAEIASGRYDNAANRCYYACFQAAIAALEAAGFRPSGGSQPRWSHESVQALFVGVLINQRKRYPSNLRSVLSQLSTVRLTADYTRTRVSGREARRVLRQSQMFVAAIRDE
jgi:uncharacterized protein (UPF0332 family)